MQRRGRSACAAGAALLACALLLAAPRRAAGQFGMPRMGGGDEPKAAAVASDIPFIRCHACEAFVKQASRHVRSMREGLKPGQKLDEGDVIDYLEQMCDPYKPNGGWLTHYDIVEAGPELKLIDKGKASKCNSECATLARACAQLADALDLSDLSEALYQGKTRSALTQLACYEATDACRKKAPPLPKDRAPGPAHVPLSEEEAQREKIMASMKAAGLGGQMYSRDDLTSQISDLAERAEDGEFPEVKLTEAAGGGGGGGGGAAAGAEAGGGVAAAAARAQEAVAGAADAAAAAVGQASSFLKGKLGTLSKRFRAAGGGGGEL